MVYEKKYKCENFRFTKMKRTNLNEIKIKLSTKTLIINYIVCIQMKLKSQNGEKGKKMKTLQHNGRFFFQSYN